MDSVSSVSVFPENTQTTQPFLSKRGLTLQGNTVNPSLGAEKIATQETAPPPQTPQKNAIDIKV
jgi:hypothetical protein